MTENITFLQLCWRAAKIIILHYASLVSSYIVCERLSAMHELAGVVENLVKNSESAPLSEQTPPSQKLKFRQILALEDFSVLTC